jgi:hypothetical protein
MRRRFMPIACALAILAGGLLASATAPTVGLTPADAKASGDKPQLTRDETVTTPITIQTIPGPPTTPTNPTTPTTSTTPTTPTTPAGGRAESWAGVTATDERAGLPAQPDTVTVGGSGSTLTDALDDAEKRAKTIAKHEHITLGDVSAVSSPKAPTAAACGQVYDGPDIGCGDETVVVSYDIDDASDIQPPDAAP